MVKLNPITRYDLRVRENTEEHIIMVNKTNELVEQGNQNVDSINEVAVKFEDVEISMTNINSYLDYLNIKVDILDTKITTLDNSVEDIEIDISNIHEDSNLNLRAIDNTANSSTVNIIGVRKNNTSQTSILPVVSSLNAGILNVADYNGFKSYEGRISALEGGTPPTPVEITLWTLLKAGIIKGSNRDGELYPNADGTGSVIGWDTVKNDINTSKANITSLQNTKVDKLTVPPLTVLSEYVYSQQITAEGVRSEIGHRASANVVNNAIVSRGASGQIPVPLNPSNSNDAVSKYYVDNKSSDNESTVFELELLATDFTFNSISSTTSINGMRVGSGGSYNRTYPPILAFIGNSIKTLNLLNGAGGNSNAPYNYGSATIAQITKTIRGNLDNFIGTYNFKWFGFVNQTMNTHIIGTPTSPTENIGILTITKVEKPLISFDEIDTYTLTIDFGNGITSRGTASASTWNTPFMFNFVKQ
jgi:hypothetical protein